MIKSFEKTSGKHLNYSFGPRRAGDIIQIWADTTLAEKELGWHSELSLDEMTLCAWRWQEQLGKN